MSRSPLLLISARPLPPPSPPQRLSRRLAAIPLPSPKLAVATTSVALLVYCTTRPIAALFASSYLGTRCSIDALHVSPFRRRCTFRGVTLLDPRGRPLISAEELRLSFANIDDDDDDGRGSGAPSRHVSKRHSKPKFSRVLDVELTKPAVVALFDTYDFSASNWTLFTDAFRRRHNAQPPTTPSKPLTTKAARPKRSPTPPPPPPPPPSSKPEAAEQALDVRVSIVGGVKLSLRSTLLDGARLIDDVTLSDVRVRTSELSSPEGVGRFVNALAGRAVRSARVRSLPRAFREGARRYARKVVEERMAEGVRVTREGVRRVREGVDVVDEFVLRDMPDVGTVGEVLRGVRKVVKGVEGVLGGWGEEHQERERRAAKEREARTEAERMAREATAQRETEFRELDEDDDVSPQVRLQ